MERKKRVASLLLLTISCGWMPIAQAGLGDAATSVARDRQVLRADTATTTSMPMYDRHEITTADGATIHEFVAHDGTVFAVNFSGPAIPDMKTMLGAHYDSYLAAAKAHRGNHHVMSFTADGMVVTIIKLPRGFQGAAHLPALLPQGVNAQDLQ
jgi:hypothetical protein